MSITESFFAGFLGGRNDDTIMEFHASVRGGERHGDVAMSTVMIRCPSTGRAVSTAIEMEVGDFRRLPHIAAKMRCPACGQDHVWQPASAWLNGAPRVGIRSATAEVVAA